tara:strand:+ start:950 stop:1192 length:243 start_codon:yes stop_codon:yes gene_type:complete
VSEAEEFQIGDLVRFLGWQDAVGHLEDHRMATGTIGLVLHVVAKEHGKEFIILESYQVLWQTGAMFWMQGNEIELINRGK